MKTYLSLWFLRQGGGAESQILRHIEALRQHTKIQATIVCSKESTIEGQWIERWSAASHVLHRGTFVSYLSRDHAIGSVRKLLQRGPWIAFERTHPGFYELQAKSSMVSCMKHFFQILAYRYLADGLLVQTESAKLRWQEKLRTFPPEKIFVLPNIYDVQLEKQEKEIRRRIVMVGRLIPIKDYPLALEAFAILKTKIEFVVDIYGVGPEKTMLEKKAKDLGIGEIVNFRGFLTNKDEIYTGASLVLMTSHFEGSPNAIGEAMSYGLPVVTLDFDAGPRDLLGGLDRNQMITSRNPEELADLMLKQLSDPNRARNIGDENQKKIAQEFSGEQFAKKFSNALNSFLQSR